MRLTLVNPSNPFVSLAHANGNHWNRYRVWRPLGLLVLAGLTPPEWEVTLIDENLGIPDYDAMPNPDLVGITAFTSQAPRAYEVAALFRAQSVPVVMGGIHVTVREQEALQFADAVVTGEAEPVWLQVLEDAVRHNLRRVYCGGLADMDKLPHARHDLAPKGYKLGSIQTTRGCPLACTFCSVSVVNGRRYRFRPIDQVISEMKTIPEKLVLVVDDNLIGMSASHIARAKALFREMTHARLGKQWICQATINFGDDDELLALAAAAGCVGAFVGFESPSPDGLKEVGKKFNLNKNRDPAAAVRRMQKHGIAVAGSFIMGLDSDQPGIGRVIAEAANVYGVDYLNVLFLTPLPGTKLWNQMEAEGRVVANNFPSDWRYYTLNCPVAHYRNFTSREIMEEMNACGRTFYSYGEIARRALRCLYQGRNLIVALMGNLSNRGNLRFDEDLFERLSHASPEPQTSAGESARMSF